MLSVELRPADFRDDVRASEGVLLFGSSRIEAFASAFVQSRHSVDGESLVAAIAEFGALDPFADEPVWIDGFAQTDRQGVELTIARTVAGDLTMRRTDVPGVPLYVSWSGGTLVVSWRFEEAVANIPSPRPDPVACRIYVENGPALARDTVIAGVRMLWPGETLRLVGGELSFDRARAVDIVLPATITTEARVTDALQELIAASMRPLLEVARRPVVELSGGLDSACVALAAVSCMQDMCSYGLVHSGAVGAQQRARRAELVAALGLSDFEYAADADPQIASLQIGEARVTPFDDNQRIPCARAVERHPAGNVDLILSGVGGDELTMERTFRRLEHELPGSASASSLTVAAGRADMFLRRGIWTVNPLCVPSVVNFCRALPRPLRRHRTVNLLLLARAGLSDGYLFPRYAEGYGHAMQREAALFDFDAALDGSVVAEHRVLDYSDLLERARRASNGGLSYELIGSLFWLLKLEAVLRQYVR